MRQLQFVSLTEDGQQVLVETVDGTEQFALTVDAALRSAVGTDLPRLPSPARPAPAPVPAAAAPAPPVAAAPVTEPPIGPREIQVRVRAGESPDELAATYGMTLERVMRFAAPVLDERLRIADEARRARARRSGNDIGEGKLVVFGEAVDERFQAHGIAPESVTWNSRRRDDGEWLIVADWLGGEARHSAEWLFSRSSRSVAPLDETASDLLSDRPIRPIAPPEPVRPSLVSAPPLARGVVAFPPMPDAHTVPVPVLEDVFDQEAAPEGPRKRPREVPPLVPAASAIDFDAPPLPLGITDPATRPGARRNSGGRRDESEDDRAARARIPSWDDILLGVRRKED